MVEHLKTLRDEVSAVTERAVAKFDVLTERAMQWFQTAEYGEKALSSQAKKERMATKRAAAKSSAEPPAKKREPPPEVRVASLYLQVCL